MTPDASDVSDSADRLAEAPRRPPMGLARRLGMLTAGLALVAVVGATAVALRWSEAARLEDLRLESLTLASTLASYLSEVSPAGDADLLGRTLGDWSRHRISEAAAWVVRPADGRLAVVAGSESARHRVPDAVDSLSLANRTTLVRRMEGDHPGWRVTVPLSGGPSPGVLNVVISTARLRAWDRLERRRSYGLAVVSALVVALGAAALTARWVGRPLAALSTAMAGARAGARGAPTAEELGPPEFRLLARQYNRLTGALAIRERESESRAALLRLADRARSFERLALMEETAMGFAHEIGTPLNTVQGHLQLLRDDLGDAHLEPAAQRVDVVLGQVDRMAAIVRRGLDRGAWPAPQRRALDLAPIAERVLRFMEPTFLAAGLSARLETDGTGPVMTSCDPAMVEQILLNLLKNAVEASPRGGEVRVRVAPQGDRAMVQVADDGPGLAPEARDGLFHAFATTKGSHGGTGLGLAVSRRLALMLGGDLVYVPTASGACWHLLLPAAG